MSSTEMAQKTSEHIERLMCFENAIRKQFEFSKLELELGASVDADPLLEDQHEVVPGMINKYGNRVLLLLTTECPAYCRFCTRRRMVSKTERGTITRSGIDAWVKYLQEHPEVQEVIISGGDPFIVEDSLFDYALKAVGALKTVGVIRIGTRAPVTDPTLVTSSKLDSIRSAKQPVYVGIHFEHPSEITQPTVECVNSLRSAGAILYSQTVFLKGINDDVEVLRELFNGLLRIGVVPYYIYRCDPVPGTGHFRADIAKEREIMTQLRKSLSGLACPTYVIDVPHGVGKIPVPLGFWEADLSSYTDFHGNRHDTE